MGIAVSNGTLACAVSMAGQLGVVSGTALATVFVRRLQDGDPGSHLRRAMVQFPVGGVAQSALDENFLSAERAAGAPYRPYRPPADVPLAHHAPTSAAHDARVVHGGLARQGGPWRHGRLEPADDDPDADARDTA